MKKVMEKRAAGLLKPEENGSNGGFEENLTLHVMNDSDLDGLELYN